MSRPSSRRTAALLAAVLLASAASTPSPLYVHLIPHSHCDPGWLNSFETYYTREVHAILDNVVEQLGKAADRRFGA